MSEVTELCRNALYVCKLVVMSSISVGFLFFSAQKEMRRGKIGKERGRKMITMEKRQEVHQEEEDRGQERKSEKDRRISVMLL